MQVMGSSLLAVALLLGGAVPLASPLPLDPPAHVRSSPILADLRQAGPSARFGGCPDLPIVKDFQADKYLGRWYEITKLTGKLQTGDCVTADYSLLGNCSIGLTNTHLLADGTEDRVMGVANSAGDPTRGSLIVSYADSRGVSSSPTDEGNYNVLATDYTNYAVVHSCSTAAGGGPASKFEEAWILARRPRVNQLFLARLKDWLTRLGLDTSQARNTRQLGCQYSSV